MEEARALILEHFNGSPEEWSVVFTAGATAALKLAAEAFPWQEGARLVYAHNSHTSVLGMREVARGLGAGFACLPSGAQYGPAEDLAGALAAAVGEAEAAGSGSGIRHLVVLPGECNFSGRKLDIDTLQQALALLGDGDSDGGSSVSVLLDAAKLVGTAPLDLSALPRGVDMLALSFYKLVGYPTGLGCLLLRHAAPWVQAQAKQGRRGYFGGGTVLAALPARDFVRLRPEPAHRWADGTQDYMGIIAVAEGLRTLRALGGDDSSGMEAMAAVAAHTGALGAFVHDALAGLRHGNGAPVAELYSARPTDPLDRSQGSIVAFNLRRADGAAVGYAEVEKLCGLHNLQLRTGCFCNPGGCQAALGLSEADVLHQLAAGHVCWDETDLVDGRPTGAVRASFGYMSAWEDACALLDLVDKYFVSKACPLPVAPAVPSPPSDDALALGAILLYPIKSCGAMRVDAWPVGATGLLFDREWALVDAQGQALRLNRLPQMRFVRPSVDLEAQELRVAAPGMPELRVPLTLPSAGGGISGGSGGSAAQERVRDMSVCGEACQGVGYLGALQEEVDAWFSSFLGKPCALVRAVPHAAQRRAAHQRQRQRRRELGLVGEGEGEGGHDEKEEEGKTKKKKKKEIGFSNEAQFLLVSQASVEHLNGLIARQQEQEEEGAGTYEFRYEVRHRVVCRASIRDLEGRTTRHSHHLTSMCTPDPQQQGRRPAESPSFVTVENFRPNLVVAGGVAHQEDLWAAVELLPCPAAAREGAGVCERGVRLQVTGPCARCSMVNIDHQKAQKQQEEPGGAKGGSGGGSSDAIVAPVLKTLASYRRDQANIYFGQFLVFADDDGDDGGVGGGAESQGVWLRTGMRVRARRRSDEAGGGNAK